DSLQRAYLRDSAVCDADGRFEIAVLPGPGILGFSAGSEFPTGVGAERIDCPREEGTGDFISFLTAPKRCGASGLNLVLPLNPQPDDREVTADLTVNSGATIPGRVVGPDGRLLGDYVINGARRGIRFGRESDEAFTIVGYFPTETRRVT